MFYHISGEVAALEPYLAVIDCGGVGYALNTSLNTLSHLQLGQKAKLYTYLQVREDLFELYGFYSLAEKRCFEMLISVSGVGPRAALSVLSSATPEGVTMAILSGNEKALTCAQGIGKKIAQRIILELKDKMQKMDSGFMPDMSDFAAVQQPAAQSRLSDAVAALTVLGYSNAEITAALKGIDVPNTALEDVIRAALKNMVR